MSRSYLPLLPVPLLLVVLAVASAWASSAGSLEPGYERAPYLQNLGRDSVLVAWIATADGEPAVDFGPTREYGRTVVAESDGARRVAALRELTPGTRYYYRVRAGDRVLAAGAQYTFRTDEGSSDRSFSFFMTADVGAPSLRQRHTIDSIRRHVPVPEFGILAGDIVYERGRSADYDERFMRPWAEVMRQIPLWPALGNHDWKSDPKKNFEREWYLPGNEHYYSFDYGSAHFIALDTRGGDLYDRKEQVRWLRRELEAHEDAEWLFVFLHHPGYTCTYKGKTKKVVEHFLPLFDRYGVDVVFTGHAHTYERLFPIHNGEVVSAEQDPHYEDPAGTIYIGSGTGGKVEDDPDRRTRDCKYNAFYQDRMLLWAHVEIEGPTCTIRAFASEENDRMIDEVRITKRTRTARTAPPERRAVEDGASGGTASR